jgi:cell migration-inducing and hyaluronan-binding protein
LQGLLARYPVHFHLFGERSGQGNFVKDCAIHDNYQRCVVIHDSNGITVQNNVAYHTFGHAIFLEDGGEMSNLLDHNLVVSVFAAPTAQRVIPSDDSSSAFWITNLNNTITNNVAVSGHHGFWLALPQHPTGLSATKYANNNMVWPVNIPLKTFDSNVAHRHTSLTLSLSLFSHTHTDAMLMVRACSRAVTVRTACISTTGPVRTWWWH